MIELIEVPQQLQVEAYIAERHPLLKGLVDDSIYTNDREFRLPGSTKYDKSAVLGPVNPAPPTATLWSAGLTDLKSAGRLRCLSP